MKRINVDNRLPYVAPDDPTYLQRHVTALYDVLRDLAAAINELPILTGSGSPEGVYAAPVGWIFLRSDGGASTTLYVKTSGTGNTGWTGK